MRFICLPLCCVLLCLNIISIVSQECTDQNDRNKTTFIELNGDVLFLIFEQFDFMEILNLVEAIPMISPIGAEIFRKRKYEVEIDFGHSDYPRSTKLYNRLIFSNTSIISNTLKGLGRGIQRLKIQNWRSKPVSSNINGLINQYTSDSLAFLQIFNIDENSFVNFTLPFSELDELEIVFPNLKGVVNLTMPLNQLFPKLRRLFMDLHDDAKFIDCKFSKLEHVAIRFKNVQWNNWNNVRNFVKKNAQIKSAIFWRLPIGSLRTINKYWPNLENLTINLTDIGNDAVQFKHMKMLHLINGSAHSLNKLSFASLESLRMEYSPAFSNEWNEFIEKHNNLTHLHAELRMKAHETDLVELTTKLPNLIEMKITCSVDLQIQSIERILQTHDKLMKFRIKQELSLSPDNEIFQHSFGNEWHIESYHFKYIGLFDRIGFLATRRNL